MSEPTSDPMTEPRIAESRGEADSGGTGVTRRDRGSGLRLSGIYLLVASIVVFSLWIPETFFTVQTFRLLLNEQAIFAMAALALLLPLAVGQLDISIGATMTLSAVVPAWLMTEYGVDPAWAVLAALGVGLVVGAVNGLLVVRFHISSIIATIATMSALEGLVLLITGNQQIIGLPDSIKALSRTQIGGGISILVVYMLLMTAALWYLLERTPVGRRMLATGGAEAAARLSGVPTTLLTFWAFVAGGVIASFAGLVLLARVGAATPTIGEPFLLPAFAAVFLGATQIKSRVNAWGTLVAVILLATIVKGLQLAGAEFWVPPIFNGAALAIGVGLAQMERRRAGEETTMTPH